MTTENNEKPGRFQTWFRRLSLIGMTLVFLMAIYGILFRIGIVEIMGEPLQILVAALGYAILLVLLTSILDRLKRLTDKQMILLLLGIHLLLVLVYIGTNVFEQRHEIQYINNAAIMMGSGFPLTDYLKGYFLTYPSVLHTSYVLSGFYAIFHFLQLDQWASSLVPAAIACINSIVCIPCTYSITKRFTKNRKASIFATVCYVLFPSIIVNSIVAYHFTLMFSVPILMLWLLVQIADQPKTFSKILCGILFGIGCGFGAFIGTTPCIPFIAFVLLGIGQKRVRKWIALCALSIACSFGCFTLISNHYYYENIYDEKLSDSVRTPNEAYLLLSLDENSYGFYKDNTVTLGYSDFAASGETTYAQRKEFLQAEIQKQFQQYTPITLMNHYLKKTTAEFDLGSFFSEWKDNTVYNTTTSTLKSHTGAHLFDTIPVFEWIGYDSLCQGIYMLVLLCALGSIPILWKKKEFLPFVLSFSLCGFALATTIWETSPRHIYMMLPYILVLAGIGVSSITNIRKKKNEEIGQSEA